MIFFGGKSEHPVSGRVGRDVRLIDPADGEALHNVPVRPLQGRRVVRIERAFMLVHQNAVVLQRLETASVKRLGEKSFPRAERIGGVDDVQIVGRFLLSHKFHAVLVADPEFAVCHPNVYIENHIRLKNHAPAVIHPRSVHFLQPRAVCRAVQVQTLKSVLFEFSHKFVVYFRKRNARPHHGGGVV
ncbi:hypothetical protein SDC9_122827 [bioreactor metagenome]|uniref:Uncharacterized protein n=1 Tax=bioreactor metagenome TaxID=1076179 RepID=A0A645CG04_9ZZZZ